MTLVQAALCTWKVWMKRKLEYKCNLNLQEIIELDFVSVCMGRGVFAWGSVCAAW